MRHAAGELADGFHLLRLTQRRFSLLAKLRFRVELGRERQQPFQGIARGDRKDAGEDRGDKQGQADQSRKHITQLSGPSLPVLEKNLLGVQDRFDVGSDLVQQLPILRRIDDGERGIALPLFCQRDACAQLLVLGVSQTCEFLNTIQLDAVIGGQRAQGVELLSGLSHRGLERIKFRIVRAEQKAAN